MPVTSGRLGTLLLFLAACHPSQPPQPSRASGDRSPVPGPTDAIFTTVNHPNFPVGRWMDLVNPGNYRWVVFRLEAYPTLSTAIRSGKAHPGDVQLDLAAVHIDGDLEWDESDLIKKLPVDRQPDGTLAGTLELAPKANAARIRLSRTGDGTGIPSRSASTRCRHLSGPQPHRASKH